jgi:hypothetical protein
LSFYYAVDSIVDVFVASKGFGKFQSISLSESQLIIHVALERVDADQPVGKQPPNVAVEPPRKREPEHREGEREAWSAPTAC